MLNADATFVAANLNESFERDMVRAYEAIDSGEAKKKLDNVISFTQKWGYLVHKEL